MPGCEHGCGLASLREIVQALRIGKTSIARRYGCSATFIHECLKGTYPMPKRLVALLKRMIQEQVAYYTDVLDRLKAAPSVWSSGGEDGSGADCRRGR
ncbi:MAG: hypothetical protein PHR35_21535 [Kiritimatiellae bacterium]|nr:hypothetical protein [Kiritimatiellia bacterium]